MPRRKNDLLQERVVLAYDHVEVTGDLTVKLWKVPAGRSFRLDRALYINPTGLAEDASNHFNVKVLKGSTIMANWSTDSDLAGTNSIPADTFIDLTLSSTDADTVAAAADVISLFLDETGTQTLPAGRVVLEGRLI